MLVRCFVLLLSTSDTRLFVATHSVLSDDLIINTMSSAVRHEKRATNLIYLERCVVC